MEDREGKGSTEGGPRGGVVRSRFQGSVVRGGCQHVAAARCSSPRGRANTLEKETWQGETERWGGGRRRRVDLL